jgi:hypothetical protein
VLLNVAANVIDQLNDRSFPDNARLDPVIELSTKHGVISEGGRRRFLI